MKSSKDQLVTAWEICRQTPHHVGKGEGYLANDMKEIDEVVARLKSGEATLVDRMRAGQMSNDRGTYDIWAKRWIPTRDAFEWKRFMDCKRSSSYHSGSAPWEKWTNVEEGWVPVFFLESPTAPQGDHRP